MSAADQAKVLGGTAHRLFGFRSSSCAAWVTGENGQEHAIAVVAPRHGPRIPSAPAVLLSRKLLTGGIAATGAFPCVGFLSVAEFISYLSPFGIKFVRGKDGRWGPTVEPFAGSKN